MKGPKVVAVKRFTGLVLGSVLCFVPLAAWACASYAAANAADEQQAAAEAQTVAFDIAPQPLLTALRAYGEATGQAVLVDNTLATGRQSPGVRGELDKVEALQRLLAGTGLVASYSSDQAFTLKLAEPGEAGFAPVRERPEADVGGGTEVVTERYAGAIQQPIEAALCRSSNTRPGTYRLAVQLWIAPSGKVLRTRLLTRMQDTQRESEIRTALDQLTLAPPSPQMPQPVTLLLLPDRQLSAAACADAAATQG
ncbi:STN domain-containing protein [Dyella acidiphila]|uniref:TonB-dependent outer membrane receptor n=1 Tax=Dyella acidiphila TaxID=2775866 RepID=A0ABR9GED8_9GAMM|nr:STN domain-containing protein [Dyella acidiphila]MBE1162422.1 TonB-dependent outer membrane receptor [Dyella acidiphila]